MLGLAEYHDPRAHATFKVKVPPFTYTALAYGRADRAMTHSPSVVIRPAREQPD
jgi:hypothetical protein